MIKHTSYLHKKLKNNKFKENYDYEKLLIDFAVMIQKERIKKGFSQEELAKKAHITQQQLSGIERGSNFTIKTLLKIGKALDIENVTFKI